MPSRRNPNDLLLGSGLAGRGSVAITSVTFTTGSGSAGDVSASQVSNETPLALSGENVQEHINQAALQNPIVPLPNQVGETVNPSNSGEVDTNPASALGFYFDGGATAAALVNVTSFTVEGVFFPADRGVLVLERDGTAIAALNLATIFLEGDPEDTVAPSRGLGQDDYTAGDNANADVGGLPQAFSLTKRLPVDSAYADPLFLDDYTQDFPAQQIATFSAAVTQVADTASEYQVVHYRSVRDFTLGASGRTYGSSDVPTGAGVPVYVDGTAATPTVNSFTSSTSGAASAGSKFMSGLSVYDPDVDTLSVNLSVDDLFDNSFLERGITIRQQPGQDEDSVDLIYTDYDGGNPAPGQTASFNAAPGYAQYRAVEVREQLVASNAFGDTAIQTTTTPEIFLVNGFVIPIPGGTPAIRNTVETFKDETVRFAAPGSALMEPNGIGTTWDATLALSPGDAQVRPLSLGADFTIAEGGELGYPQTDYSTGYLPSGNPDYSAFAGQAAYYRAFDMGGPYREGRLRIVGVPNSANLFEDFRWDPTVNNSANNFGHPEGLRIDIGVDPSASPSFDLGRPYAQGGALTGFTIESANSVVVSFLLDDTPEYSPQGYHPLKFGITWFDNTAANVVFYKVELLPAE